MELMQPLIGAGSNGIDDTFGHPTNPTTNSSLELLPSGVDLVLSNGVTSASIRSVFPDANSAVSSNFTDGLFSSRRDFPPNELADATNNSLEQEPGFLPPFNSSQNLRGSWPGSEGAFQVRG